MTRPATCPHCLILLIPSAEDHLRCETCAGVFVTTPGVQFESLNEVTSRQAAVADRDTPGDLAELNCPACALPMTPGPIDDSAVHRCPACGGVWLEGAADPSTLPPQAVAASLGRYLLYSLTLPERAVRSTIGLTAGAAREAAAFLVPQAFQSSKTYEIVVRNSLRFLTEDIGGAARPATEAAENTSDYMARKAVGNFVDLAGLASLHVSPLWFLAVVSDVAYGTRSYVAELAEELKKQGLIDETSTIHHVDDVLEAVRNASGQAASLFDTPPLSVDELKASLDRTRSAVQSADYRRVLPEAELADYWKQMRDIAAAENVSLLGVSGALTMHTLGKIGTVTHGTLAGVQVAGGLFNRHVIGHYAESLETLKRQGFYQTVRESYAPYVEAVWNNLALNKSTWTEQIVSGQMFGRAYRTMKTWFSRPSEPESLPCHTPENRPHTAEIEH